MVYKKYISTGGEYFTFSCIVMVDFSIVRYDNKSCDNYMSTMFYIVIHSA